MTLPKRHHFIPQMIQRRFVNSEGNLFAFDRRRPSAGVLAVSPANLFVGKHLYSKKEKSGEKDPELEERLSRLEGMTDTVIRKIEAAAEQGHTPALTKEEKEVWDLYFYVQWKRTPDSFEKTSALTEFDDAVREAIAEFEEDHRPLTESEREDLKNPEVLARIMHNARVTAVSAGSAGSAAVMHELANKGLAILKMENENKSFILGSNPIAKLTFPGRTHISDPSVEIWFPISSKLAVSPSYSAGEEKFIATRDGSVARHINMAITSQSTTIAGPNDRLIASLARPR